MYQALTFYHSLFRWLVLLSLSYAILLAYRGYVQSRVFSVWDNRVRHWTATIAHIQLVLGMLLYTQSPIVRYFWKNRAEAIENRDTLFFGLVHILLMLTAIVLVTIGSSLARRKTPDRDKFRSMFIWFALALLIIFCAIPWPFSPLAARPYLR
jgi:hypothetical protein